ncbi:MAG: thiamine diphosphokinase [Anaerolineales bacterium]|nr:thiamine diphosphokinase [Anaerolineales bacterium]
MRAVIFANGLLSHPEAARQAIRPDDLLIAADGGLRHCQHLGLTPSILIGDFDSLDEGQVSAMRRAAVRIIRHPARKDSTDLELAVRHAKSLGATDILVLAGLGARWDQTLANLLLPAAADLDGVRLHLQDGPQEMHLLRGDPQGTPLEVQGSTLEIHGAVGDTVSLIPLGGDASGITTHGLEYPLRDERLAFASSRGISNTLLASPATVSLKEGLLMCIVIHNAAPV